MLTKFLIDKKNKLVQGASLAEAVWIDAMMPTLQERDQLEKELNILLPLHHEMHQIEFSNRFYQENNALYLSVVIVTKAAPLPESHIISLIITKDKLITLRFSAPKAIQNLIEQIEQRHIFVNDHLDIFISLLERMLGATADVFELIGEQSDELAMSLIGTINKKNGTQSSNKNLNKKLREINYLQSLLGKGYQSLASLGLLISFSQQECPKLFKRALPDSMITLNHDIHHLVKHSEHLTQKLGFELQSTLGLINIEQNQIIKTFTVLAMVFMPPTLIASIYGMNFQHMPELGSTYGYPIALIIMVCSAFLPYRFFKRKGWI